MPWLLCAQRDGSLAGQDASPQLELDADLVAHGLDGGHQVERAAHRPLGVILERGRARPRRP